MKALREELDTLKSEREQERSERELAETFAKLEREIDGFDSAGVRQLLEELAGGEIEPLLRQLHFAKLGMNNPAKMEERMAENLKKKQSAGMVPSGGETPQTSRKMPTDPRKAKELALQEYAGGG